MTIVLSQRSNSSFRDHLTFALNTNYIYWEIFLSISLLFFLSLCLLSHYAIIYFSPLKCGILFVATILKLSITFVKEEIFITYFIHMIVSYKQSCYFIHIWVLFSHWGALSSFHFKTHSRFFPLIQSIHCSKTERIFLYFLYIRRQGHIHILNVHNIFFLTKW